MRCFKNFVHKSEAICKIMLKKLLGIPGKSHYARILRECACTASTKTATFSGGVY